MQRKIEGEVIRHTGSIRYSVITNKPSSPLCINMYKDLRDAKSLFKKITECNDIEEATLCITAIHTIKRRISDGYVSEENIYYDQPIAIFLQY